MPVPVSRVPLIGCMALATSLNAQSLSSRIEGVRSGTVRLSYATRASVCGDGQFIGFDLPDAFYQYSHWNDGYSVNVLRDVKPECRSGPLRLVVVKSGGQVVELRAAVGVAWRASETAIDLGTVGAAEAATWLVGLVESSADDVTRIALLAAASADSARIAGRVLELARDRRLTARVRERAIRWASVVAAAEGGGDEVDRVLRAIAVDGSEAVGLRERAFRSLRPTAGNRAWLRSAYPRVREATLRERIIREVGDAGGEEDVAWVRGVALDPRESAGLRERAVRVLGEELDRPSEVRAIYARLDLPALRERALRVAAEQGGAAEDAWVRDVAENAREDVMLRDRAIRLLAEDGQTEYLRQLYPALERVELKERVIRSIAERADAGAAEWLARIVLDEREQAGLRDRAVRTLAERGAASAELVRLYDDVASLPIKQRLIRVFAERRDAAATDKLAAIAAGDPDPNLRREAARRSK